jgi:hypothetical protein
VIDLFASAPQYEAHLLPLWEAIPEQLRGERTLGGRYTKARDRAPALVAAHMDLLAARRAGYRRFVYVEHGIGQSYANGNPAYPGGRDRGDVRLFLSPNARAAAADRAIYPSSEVQAIGDPRLDSLPTRQAGPQTVAISFHWECHIVPETRSAFPHFRRAMGSLKERFNVIGHAHPRARRQMERVWRGLGIEYLPTFDEVCRRADLYVCDNSSTLYEFAATGRPVVVLNPPWYRRDVDFGLRFWEAATVGIQVDEPADLGDAIAAALSDPAPQRAAREAALALTYAHRSGAARRGAQAIAAWLA